MFFDTIAAINKVVNDFVWGVPAMVCIIGVGLLLSVRTGFLQIRKFPFALKTTIGRMFHKKEASDGAMTPFQAVCTALAGTVGTGNIAGVAGAIAIGGPGAVFWMWCSALLGMCTKYAEVTLAVHYRERSATGEWIGGPMYYIKNGLGKRWQWLAILYALFGTLTVFGTGNATQVNTITTAINTAFMQFHLVSESFLPTLNLIIGIFCAMLVAMVLLGGIKRIGSVSEKLVPFMALFYVVLGIGVVLLNLERLPGVLQSIFEGAFNPAAFTGGIIGSLFVSMQKGVSRGIFSNEAGLGTGSIAHACGRYAEARHAGHVRHLRGVCGHDYHLHADGACHPVQRHAGDLRRGSGRGADDFRLHDDIRQLVVDFHGGGAVLLRVLDDYRLGAVRLTLCAVSV